MVYGDFEEKDIDYIGSTKSFCSFEENEQSTLGLNEELDYTLICTDEDGFRNSDISINNLLVDEPGILEITNIEKTTIQNGYQYTINVKGLAYGETSLTLKNGIIKDNSGNGNTQITSNSINVIRKRLLKDEIEDTLNSYLLPDDGISRIVSGAKDDSNLKNYVWYSGKLWRIAALNSDDSIKIITNDLMTMLSWAGSNSQQYSGSYMYQWLNEDFLDSLYNYENVIVTDYQWDASTTLEANTKPDRSRLVTAPVGSLTAYEAYKSYSNLNESWLMDDYRVFWTITKDDSTRVRYFHAGSASENASIHHEYPASYPKSVRPCVNLISTIKVVGNGDGSKENPYVIEDNSKKIPNETLLNERVSGEYVKFNGEMWRIVIVDNGSTKITKNNYLYNGTTVLTKALASTNKFGASGNTKSNDYWDYYLNNTWYNSISESPINYKSMIEEKTWYYGSFKSGASYKNSICATANTTETTNACSKTTSTFTGKVGIPRVGELFSSQQSSVDIVSKSNMWLITPSDSSSESIYIYGNGSWDTSGPASNRYAVRPSLYLSANVVITSGLGTIDSPFEINLQ